jgi:arabinose operon protein AraL
MNKTIDIDGLIFDLDGTVYTGEHALPGAVETIDRLRRMDKRILFMSNKPLNPRQAYSEKLTRLGIPTPVEAVITSAFVLGRYLAQHHPDLNYYVIGEPSLLAELREQGLHLVDHEPVDPHGLIDASRIDAVVVAFDRTFDYKKLNIAYQALIRGARFFATNSDKVCPVPGGAIPDAGATIAALEAITSRKLEFLAGKPSPLILETALQVLGMPAGRCLMVGDRLETDIRMGKAAGMYTAAVLTGITRREDLATTADRPDFVLDNLAQLLQIIQLPATS